MTEQNKTLTLDEVADLARRAMAGCGAHGAQLEQAVQSIVDAECDGIRTVGLGYLPLYCGHLQVGKLNCDATPRHSQIAPSAIRSEADNGFAHAAFAESEADFYALVKSQGIAALSIVDSYSAGVVCAAHGDGGFDRHWFCQFTLGSCTCAGGSSLFWH